MGCVYRSGGRLYRSVYWMVLNSEEGGVVVVYIILMVVYRGFLSIL